MGGLTNRRKASKDYQNCILSKLTGSMARELSEYPDLTRRNNGYHFVNTTGNCEKKLLWVFLCSCTCKGPRVRFSATKSYGVLQQWNWNHFSFTLVFMSDIFWIKVFLMITTFSYKISCDRFILTGTYFNYYYNCGP